MDKKFEKRKIAFYIRVSTEEQAENPEGSIKNQEERLRAAVQFRNIESNFGEVVGIFVDRARSGKDTNRPELQRLLSAIRKQEIKLLMVTELSRLSRSLRDFTDIWELMKTNGCAFLSLRESFDTTNAAGEMVLYTMANLAQFERKQISERISANIQSRASRGLYNGGMVPLGFKLNSERRGYLEIDTESAPIVVAAYDTFLKEGTLSKTAKWLNQRGFRYKREVEGAGGARLGHFTIQNLHNVLKNPAYIGLKVYRTSEGLKNAPAVWKGFIDPKIFAEVQEQLEKNKVRKPESEKRYPFLLSGFLQCGACGERLSGKSAHGKAGKIPYYEHAWSTKKMGCEVAKVFTCYPRRLLAKKLEPVVWEKITELTLKPEKAESIIQVAKMMHEKKTNGSDSERSKRKIYELNSQLEVLAERLAQIPKSISPTPVYKQMEKIEAAKRLEEEKIRHATTTSPQAIPAEFNTYQALLSATKRLINDPKGEQLRSQIIQLLVHKIEIQPEGFRLYYYAGQNEIERGIDRVRRALSSGDSNRAPGSKAHQSLAKFSPDSGVSTDSAFLKPACSNSWFSNF